jgi:hypothetical protein
MKREMSLFEARLSDTFNNSKSIRLEPKTRAFFEEQITLGERNGRFEVQGLKPDETFQEMMERLIHPIELPLWPGFSLLFMGMIVLIYPLGVKKSA